MKKPHKIILICEALKYHKYLSLGLLVLLLLLGYAYSGIIVGNGTAGRSWQVLWDWTDPVAGIMTFFTTLIIFGMQAYKNWDQSREKRLTINYFYTGGDSEPQVIAQVIGAYLAGENDTRAWVQQLGQQIMGKLDFDMNWEDPPPRILKDKNGKYYKAYNIDIYLTSNPLESNEGKLLATKFLERQFKHSKVSGDMNSLPIIWERCYS